MTNGKIMQSRIDKIAQESGCHKALRYDPVNLDGNGWIINQKDLDKFAEMIVRECMNQIKEQYPPVLENTAMMEEPLWNGYVQSGVDCYVAINEYFFGEEDDDEPEECPTCGGEWSGTSCGAVECGWLK